MGKRKINKEAIRKMVKNPRTPPALRKYWKSWLKSH